VDAPPDAPADAAPDAPLRLASWNIRAGLGSDLRRDAERVLTAIAAMAPDLIALQEADFRMGARPTALPRALIREITGMEPLGIGANEVSLGWHGNAILARPGLALAGVERVDLPGLEPRGAVIADIEGAFPLRLVAAHFGLLRRSRRLQFDHVRAALDRLDPLPTVITGDFNEWSRKVGLGRIAKHFTLVTPRGTYPARLARAPLDRMAHTDDLSVSLIDLPRGRAPFASDHLPILAEVSPV
jgi:endonuclease/exonuclease/phosphatase family metal-dependent hydrolase